MLYIFKGKLMSFTDIRKWYEVNVNVMDFPEFFDFWIHINRNHQAVKVR